MLKVMRESFQQWKWALIAIVAAVILGFVFIDTGMGGGAVGGRAGDRAFAARVNGETITFNDFQRSLKNIEDMYRQMYGQQFTPEMAQQMGLQQQVLQSLVDQRLLVQEAGRLRIEATPEEIRKRLLSIPIFVQDGRFVGMELYTRYVTGPLGYPSTAAFEEDLGREIALQKMESAIQSSVLVSPKAAEAEYRRMNENASIRYVLLPASQQPAAAAVRPAEVEAHYRANQTKYSHGEQRQIRYLIADYARIRSQVVPGDEELRRRYEATKESYSQPASAYVQHILVRVDPGATPEVDAAMKAKADSLVQQLRGGADFATLARQHSEDPSSSSAGGVMGWIEMGQTVEPFERAIFSVPLNAISEPIRSDEYGYHIVRVSERRQAAVRSFEEVRRELVERVSDDMARDVARTEINRINALIRQNKPASVDAFSALANDKVTSNDGGWVGRTDPIGGIGSNQPLTQWAFQSKPGDVTPEPVGTARGIVIAYMAGTRPAGIMPLEEIRERVEAEIRDEKGREAARAALAQMMAGASSIDQVAGRLGQQVRDATVNRQGGIAGIQGDASQVVEAAIAGNVGELRGPILVSDGAVAIQIVDQKKLTAEQLTQSRVDMISAAREQQARSLRAVLLERLRKAARIEINDEITRPVSRPVGI
jgi:peptidyl-prolyl cis-trans isomerase D